MNAHESAVDSRLLAGFAHSSGSVRFVSYKTLVEMGEAALPTLRAGLRSDSWQVRRWSAMCLDQVADADALRDLVPLLSDPHPKVRLWAVHSLACEHCKEGVRCPVDIVPLLIDRALHDESVRVRRMAVIMLSMELREPRARPVLTRIVAEASDAKLKAHARRGLLELESAS
jgi:HEAT repeat protein